MNLVKRLRNSYQKLSIQKKLSIPIVTSVLIPMALIAIIFSGRLFSMLASDTISQEQNNASETMPLIEDVIQEILDAYSTIADSQAYNYLFESTGHNSISEALASSHGSAIADVLSDAENSSVISAARLYINVDSSESCFSDNGTYLSPVSEIVGTYWHGIFQSTNPSYLFCPPLYLGPEERTSYGNCAYIVPISMVTSEQGDVQCYLALYFQSQILEEILQSSLIYEGSLAYITNERDAVIATSDEYLIGLYYVKYDTILDNLISSNNFLERYITGEKVYLGFYYISSADWFMVTVLQDELIQASILWVSVLFLVFITAAVLVGIFISLLLSRSLTKRITAVSRQMSLVKGDAPLEIMNEAHPADEIGDLVDSYNYMVRKINRLVEEQAKAAEELRVSEFNSLQAQINPHFLYNTMDMINWRIQQGEKSEANAAIRALSRFYKLTLSRKNPITTLGNEIEHASIYMRLQNMRFDNKIDFVIDISDNMLDLAIPMLILQPLIENSLLHGILEKESKTGTIVLTGWMESETAVIMISDDGVGIHPDILASLLKEKNEPTNGNGHIAVYNTHRRLQILFGNDYGLKYKSTQGVGTEVEIRIPGHKNPDSPLRT